MNIDISQDLIIDVIINGTETKTIDNTYDVGEPAGTYLPGKDFSPTDNVSAGVITTYQVGISLSSKSNQIYPIDKLYLQSADDPQTNGTGIIPFYLLNSDPNPENITNDGLYTLFPGYNANMTSVVFGPDAGITSTSTINLTLNVNYPDGIYWKTYIAPKIYAVASKNGIIKKSDLILPTQVKMSSIADLNYNLYYQPLNDITLVTENGQKGLLVPFYINSSLTHPVDIATLLDEPEFETVTFKTNVNFSVDGTNIPVTSSQITATSISGANISIDSINVTGNVLTIVAKKNGKINYPYTIQIKAFLPYDPGSKTSVTVIADIPWNGTGVIWQNLTNQYIFNTSVTGGVNFTKVVPLVFVNPPQLQVNVAGYIDTNNPMVSNIYYQNLNFIRTLNSKLLLFYDSEISWITDAAPNVIIDYTDIMGVRQSYIPASSAYIQQYGYVPLPNSYDSNTIAKNIMNGGITLGTYAEILALGNKPNVLITTFTEELITSLNIDYTKNVTINYQQAQIEHISNTDFLTLYNVDPTKDFTSYLYTAMRMGTNYATVAEANTAYGSLLGIGDEFVSINNQTLLYLATRAIGTPTTINRFNLFSTVRADIRIPVYKTTFQTSITNDNINTIPQIFDYTQTYPLRFFIPNAFVAPSVNSTIESGSILTFKIPTDIIPYLYLGGEPTIYKKNGTISVLAVIQNYQLTPGLITIVMPKDITFENNSSVYLEIPVRFLLPSSNKVFSHNPTTLDEDSIINAYPNSIVTGFPASSKYYDIFENYVSSTLIGGGVDFTGLSVNKNLYPSGTPVTYIASVKNQSSNPTSIYISMTVPTNEYNPLETSNNNQAATIEKITPFNSNTVIYYQTATNATQADINAMKYINQPGTNLATYYNNVIVNNWTLYVPGNPLPNDVVMMVGYTPNVLTDEIIRIDYEVLVSMDPNTTNTYINDAAINYYSSASNLESQSNKVTIQNFNPLAPITVIKAPNSQDVLAKLNEKASFTINFNVPQAALTYTSLVFTDILPKTFSLLGTSTYQIDGGTALPLDATFINNVVTKSFTDIALLAGKNITINLDVQLTNLLEIPTTATSNNQASITVNDDPNQTYNSNIVIINYIFENIFNPTKSPLTQQKNKVVGEKVSFDLTFDIPQDISGLTALKVSDTLQNALTFDPMNSFLKIGDTNLGILPATLDNQTVNVDLTSYLPLASGKTVKITLGAILTNIDLLPSDNTISNNFNLNLNNIPTYSFTSNNVTVTFKTNVQPIVIIKKPNSQVINKKINEIVTFTFEFTIPQDVTGYDSLTFNDVLASCLTYNTSSTIKIGSNPIQPLNASVVGNSITKILENLNLYSGETVVINLVSNLTNIDLIPSSDQISNQGTLIVNEDPNIKSNSNIVYVYFVSNCPKCQATYDVIESVALEQTALSHILNAEGEKIQKILEISNNIEEVILINKSAASLVNKIAILENVLQGKLDIVKNCKC